MNVIEKYENTEVKINSYQPKVEVMWETPVPWINVVRACSTTQKGPFVDGTYARGSSKLIEYLIQAGHTSVLEHAVLSLRIKNISRATLDQLVRHRMGSFTASSTHYQNHANYEHFVDALSFSIPGFNQMIAQAVHMYNTAVQRDTQTARQILPLSVGTAVIWTVNARSLLNFLNLRLCKRNTVEMVLLARQVAAVAMEWFPECFSLPLLDCEKSIGCQQGNMKCGAADQYRINSNLAAFS